MTNSNILHRGIVSRTGSNDREAYHVGYSSPSGSRRPLRDQLLVGLLLITSISVNVTPSLYMV